MSPSVIGREIKTVIQPRLVNIDPVVPFVYLEVHKLEGALQMWRDMDV